MKVLTALLRPDRVVASLWRRARLGRDRLRDWAATHVFTGNRAVQTPYGFSLTAGGFTGNRLMQAGTFEPEETAIAQACFREAEVFVDVGANIGYYVCLAAQAGLPVLAFEPQPRNLACLYDNLARNRFVGVEVFPLGLGAEAGVLELFGSSGPSASLIRDWAGLSPGYRQRIAVNRMDAVIGHRLRGKRAFIKIDVEGFEYQVLRGAAEILRAEPRPTWLIEICLGEFHPQGANPDYEATFARFFDAGYRVTTADRRRLAVTRDDVAGWARAGHCPLGVFNYLVQP